MYHFSLTPPDLIIGMLHGRKYQHKQLQRPAQKYVDEVFEEVRKNMYPDKPSLFTSLWVTKTYDPKIAKKKFIDNHIAGEGYLYQVQSEYDAIPVDGRSEVEACQFYAWKLSEISHEITQTTLKTLAINFWENKHTADPEYIQDYLISGGAIIMGVKTIQRF